MKRKDWESTICSVSPSKLVVVGVYRGIFASRKSSLSLALGGLQNLLRCLEAIRAVRNTARGRTAKSDQGDEPQSATDDFNPEVQVDNPVIGHLLVYVEACDTLYL